MDINRIIAFVVTSVVIYLLKNVIKFGMKLLFILIAGSAIIYFVMPELIPVIMEWVQNFVG